MYQKMTTSDGGTIIVLERDGVRLSFMDDSTNTDHQTYLAWLAEGN